eukprot:TRINITY_DN3973_c0_g1_i1.p2 TRINITY_DN3973_c0_g1~~TRINITY_DN3973_c0_g1_i1.p2  ORF type:complete len:248 (+),score=81.23 TRINITY_DN3973_c0_g1_i1:75-818(+)
MCIRDRKLSGGKFNIAMKADNPYKVLTIPTKKALVYDHLYYKEYSKDDKDLIEVPERQALYAVRFDQPFTAEYVKKHFGIAGKVKTAHMGEYKNRSNNKKKRRQLWFAIVIYKHTEDWEKAMDSRWLQGEIYKAFGDGKGKWRISFNPQVQEEPQLTEEEKKQRDKILEMEEDGFTVMLPSTGKHSVSDGSTSMGVVTKTMIERMMNKKRKVPEENREFYEPAKKKDKRERGFYLSLIHISEPTRPY